MKKALSLVAALLFLVAAAEAPKAPVAKKVPKSSTIHGDTRVDNYAWIREKSNPAVTAYLESENAYADAMTASLAPRQKALYDEMLGHIKQTDSNVPYRDHGWYWYSRTEAGKQYPIFARKKSLDAAEEVTLDMNKLAEGQKFMGLGAYEPSDDGNFLAYSTDNSGYRQYTLNVRDLRTGSDVETAVAQKVGSVLWAADNKTILYTVENPAKRQWRLYRHVLGGKDDALVFEEKDDLYDLNADRSLSGDRLDLSEDALGQFST